MFLPLKLLAIAVLLTSVFMSASSQLSQKTILSNLPMVKDVDAEIKQLEEENAYEEPEPKDVDEIDETGEKPEEETEPGDEDKGTCG